LRSCPALSSLSPPSDPPPHPPPLPTRALPIFHDVGEGLPPAFVTGLAASVRVLPVDVDAVEHVRPARVLDQVVAGLRERLGVLRSEETRLNSSHVKISSAVFCLQKKKTCHTWE